MTKQASKNSTEKCNVPDPDWRINAFFYVAEDAVLHDSGQVIKKGALAKTVAEIKLSPRKTLTVPVPNIAAILLNASYNSFKLAKELRSRSLIDVAGNPNVQFANDAEAFDYIEKHLESIILAYTALEAFANSVIPENYQHIRHGRSKILLDVSHKEAIERTYSTEEKLGIVLPEILQCKSPKGLDLWQKFKSLKKARDKIIHAKTQESRFIQNSPGSIWEAAFSVTTPHVWTKEIIEYFASKMDQKPFWIAKFRSS